MEKPEKKLYVKQRIRYFHPFIYMFFTLQAKVRIISLK